VFDFSHFTLLHSFLAVLRTLHQIFKFCAVILNFDGPEDVNVHFSCFALHTSFFMVPRSLRAVFKFCDLGPIFDSFEVVTFDFYVLHSHAQVQWN
jgi:hypothetical protein